MPGTKEHLMRTAHSGMMYAAPVACRVASFLREERFATEIGQTLSPVAGSRLTDRGDQRWQESRVATIAGRMDRIARRPDIR
jgi:hypothetical protein